MLKRWLTNVWHRWKLISGGIAVLVMFFVPLTRVVLASTEASDPLVLNNADRKGGAGGNDQGQGVTDNTGVSSGTSHSGPTTPANPSPKSSSGGSTSGANISSKNTLGDTGGNGAGGTIPVK